MISYMALAVGFIGGGVISKTKNNIEGVTTSSVLFILVAISCAVGLGEYFLAGVSALVVYIVLQSKYIKVKFLKR